jgi:hypothetical protein
VNEDLNFKDMVEHGFMAVAARFAQHPAMGHQHTPRKNWLAGSMWDAQEGNSWEQQKFSFHTSDPHPTSTSIPVYNPPTLLPGDVVNSDYIGGGEYVINGSSNGNANIAYINFNTEGIEQSNTAIGPEPQESDDIADYW